MADETARPASFHIQDQEERRLSKVGAAQEETRRRPINVETTEPARGKERARTRENCVRCEEHNFLDGVVDLDSQDLKLGQEEGNLGPGR